MEWKRNEHGSGMETERNGNGDGKGNSTDMEMEMERKRLWACQFERTRLEAEHKSQRIIKIETR